jgi:hypothetical protein
MSMICSFLIKIYTVLVNVAHCCQNWLWLLYARTPVLLCVDRLPCLRFRTHQSWFYGPEPSMFCYVWAGFRLFHVSFMFLLPRFESSASLTYVAPGAVCAINLVHEGCRLAVETRVFNKNLRSENVSETLVIGIKSIKNLGDTCKPIIKPGFHYLGLCVHSVEMLPSVNSMFWRICKKCLSKTDFSWC